MVFIVVAIMHPFTDSEVSEANRAPGSHLPVDAFLRSSAVGPLTGLVGGRSRSACSQTFTNANNACACRRKQGRRRKRFEERGKVVDGVLRVTASVELTIEGGENEV